MGLFPNACAAALAAPPFSTVIFTSFSATTPSNSTLKSNRAPARICALSIGNIGDREGPGGHQREDGRSKECSFHGEVPPLMGKGNSMNVKEVLTISEFG